MRKQGASFTAGKNAGRVDPFTRRGDRSLDEWERAETLERMYKHGIEKVRGWMFTTPVMSQDQHDNAFQQICASKKLCTKCGRSGHFAKNCFANSMAAWAL